MSLADQASLLLIPTGYKSQKVYSIFPTDGDGDFDFSRSSSATRIAKNGLITTVAANVPRLEYPLIDGVVNGCPSLLLEPQRTNLVTYSEDFSDSSWTKSNVSITVNSTTSPDGLLNGSLMTITGGTADQRISDNVAYSGTNVFSVFAKANDSKWLSLRIGSIANKWFDLENGFLGGSTITTAFVDSFIEDFGNGWYRCGIIFTDSSTTNTRIYPAENDLDITHTSGSVYIYGAQAESSSSYATSYIPTNGTTVTRLAETCNGAGDSATFNDSEGVLMAEISGFVDTDDYRMISLNAGNSSNTLFVGLRNDTGNAYFFLISGGIAQATYISDVNATNTNVKLAVKYKENDVSFYVNGFELYTDNTATMISGLNQLEFNYGDPSESFPFYGNTKQIQYYNSALTDSELEQLTSWTSFSDMAEGQQYSIK